MSDKPRIPIRSWSKIRNSGDALNAILVDKILGAIPFQASSEECHLLGAGSIIFMANSKSLVWGSGIINTQAHIPTLSGSQIRALRGKKSADVLVQLGLAVDDVPFGDPGIFASDLIELSSQGKAARFKIAVVPHHDSMDHPFFAQARYRDDICVVEILSDGLTPIQQIADSEVVISQSLHGLVYAESLGKPSLWVSFRDDDVWSFKFEDWFTTTNNPQAKPYPIDGDVDAMAKIAELRYSRIEKTALLKAFPWELASSRPPNFLDYESCRRSNPSFVFIDLMWAPPMGQGDEPALISKSHSAFIRGVLASRFRFWAEQPYAIVISEGSLNIPNKSQAIRITKAMDAMAFVDFAYIVKRDQLPLEYGEVEVIDDDLALLRHSAGSSNSDSLISGVICVRPTFSEINDNFAVFGIS